MMIRILASQLLCLLVIIVVARSTSAAGKKKPDPVPLTPVGEKLLEEYESEIRVLREQISRTIPTVSSDKKEAFLKAHLDEGPKFQKQKPDDKKKPKQKRDTGIYKGFKQQKTTLSRARPILANLEAFLGSGAIDEQLVKAAVLANATPRGLAVYAQQGQQYKARVGTLLSDPNLMKQMLAAGGAKAGRYGKAMEILEAIRVASNQPLEGVLERLALATALELAAPELSGYTMIDPVKRYLAYQRWYLEKELDPRFKNMTTWECRHIINDYQSEEMLAWLREMVRNYRPDTVDTEYVRDQYMAINADIPQKTPQYDEDITRIQSIVCNGGRCGPKASLGRATTRAFGIPTWGARVKAHTGMTRWTPHGWTAALGVGINSSFWDKDKPERMWTTVFRLDQMARKDPEEYLKALRCNWMGDTLGEEKINGMVSGTGGFWHALALNKKRAIASDAWPNYEGSRVPWTEDAFALTSDYISRPEKSSPLVTPNITPDDRRIETDENGLITVPAAACVSPTASTAKILFMESKQGGIQLHYKRKGSPESFVYELNVPTAGAYQLTSKVVTVNRGQSLQLSVNNSEKAVDIPLPYTIGRWQETDPVKIALVKGSNTLSFTKAVPEAYGKLVWTRSGPEFGGVSIRSFTLKPASP